MRPARASLAVEVASRPQRQRQQSRLHRLHRLGQRANHRRPLTVLEQTSGILRLRAVPKPQGLPLPIQQPSPRSSSSTVS
jgi:hypothetical protein